MMAQNCLVCGSEISNKGNVQFFKFPEDLEINKQWLRNCSCDEENIKDTEYLWLCSQHFDPTCFETTEDEQKMLKKDAVPTIFIKTAIKYEIIYDNADAMEEFVVKIKLKALNPHIVCMLCAGYLVNATTIVECLHTFCKSCIVKYIQIYKKCPTCANLLPETEPLSGLMLDRTVQDIMTKILPRIDKDEEEREAEFMASVKNQKLKDADRKRKMVEDHGEEPLYDLRNFPVQYRTDGQINLYLQLDESRGEKEIGGMKVISLANQYVRCSSRIQIVHLKKMIKKLYEPHSVNYMIDVVCGEHSLNDHETLKMAYVLYWKKRQQPMVLKYSFESPRD